MTRNTDTDTNAGRRADQSRLTRRTILATASAGAAMAAFAPRARAAGEAIAIRLDWTPWGEQAAYHLAKEKGWYAQHGLDVTINDGNGSTSTVQIVANDSSLDAGVAALSSMMIGHDKGEPLKAIAAYARNSDIGLMVPQESTIRKVADLRGRKLGYTASSLEGPFLDSFLATGGLTRNDCQLFNLDGGAKIGAYLAARLDGAFSSIPFFLPAVQAKRPSRAILFGDVGLRFPSYGVFATESKIAARGDALKRFVSVSSGAWAYIAAGHEAEGVAAIRKARPEAKLPDAVMLAQIKTFLTFFPTPATKGKPLGWQASQDWADAVKTMADAKLIKPADAASAFYTDALFDEALYHAVAGTT